MAGPLEQEKFNAWHLKVGRFLRKFRKRMVDLVMPAETVSTLGLF